MSGSLLNAWEILDSPLHAHVSVGGLPRKADVVVITHCGQVMDWVNTALAAGACVLVAHNAGTDAIPGLRSFVVDTSKPETTRALLEAVRAETLRGGTL
jgi:hypothetical protein